jgi:hypothetical protein
VWLDHAPRHLQRGLRGGRYVFPDLFVGADLDAGEGEFAEQHGVDTRRVENNGPTAFCVPHQGFARNRIAHEEAVGTDKIRRPGALFQERNVQVCERALVQQDMQHRVKEGRVGLGADRQPLAG